MGRQSKNIIEAALGYACSFFELQNDHTHFHDYNFIKQTVALTTEVAIGEKLADKNYELALVALIFHGLEIARVAKKLTRDNFSLKELVHLGVLRDKDVKEVEYYLDFFDRDRLPQRRIEEVISDGKQAYLGMSDALERLDLLRKQNESINNKKYSDLEWTEFCKQYFISHPFYTRFANKQFGPGRSRNYNQLEKRLKRTKSGVDKKSLGNVREAITGKESEDLFK